MKRWWWCLFPAVFFTTFVANRKEMFVSFQMNLSNNDIFCQRSLTNLFSKSAKKLYFFNLFVWNRWRCGAFTDKISAELSTTEVIFFPRVNETRLCRSPRVQSLMHTVMNRTSVHLAAVAQEVERQRVGGSTPALPQATCRSVLGQDTEP